MAYENENQKFQEVSCPICGKPVPSIVGKGRPRQFHPECRKIDQLFNWMERDLPNLQATNEKKKEIRSRLWSLANLMNK